MLPVLSWKVVESKQYLAILGQAGHGLVVFGPVLGDEAVAGVLGCLAVLSFVDGVQILLGLALPCRDGGSLFSTLAALCTQHRCCRVLGQTSCSACQKPSAPSPVASSGSSTSPFSSRKRSSSSRQLWALSRKPSSTASSSFRPLASAPISTSRHCRSCSSRGVKWTPSAQR